MHDMNLSDLIKSFYNKSYIKSPVIIEQLNLIFEI